MVLGEHFDKHWHNKIVCHFLDPSSKYITPRLQLFLAQNTISVYHSQFIDSLCREYREIFRRARGEAPEPQTEAEPEYYAAPTNKEYWAKKLDDIIKKYKNHFDPDCLFDKSAWSVPKQYDLVFLKKLQLQIHPDKHMNSEQNRAVAAAFFKEAEPIIKHMIKTFKH
jgi:hypothetical protein